MGRPPKKDEEKQKIKVTLSLTETDFEKLGAYERKTGITEHAQAARLLFLEGLRKVLGGKNTVSEGESKAD